MQFQDTFPFWKGSSQIPGQNIYLMQPISAPAGAIPLEIARLDWHVEKSTFFCIFPTL